MLRSLYAGVSGLRNSQIRLDVIGNNIANVNTIGFKSSRVTFKDMLSQTLQAATSSQDGRGGVNPMQVGLGVTVGSIDTNHTQGSRQTTGKTEDLSIEGNGFFVLRSGNSIVYTRAGAFDKDENGYLVVPGTGMKVQGWVDGQLKDITISGGSSYAAEPTSTISFANNLNAYAQGDEKTFTTTADVYDSLGGLHTVTLEFTKEETPSGSNTELNRWRWTVKEPQVFQTPAATTAVTFQGQNLDSDDTVRTGAMTVFDAAGNPHEIDYQLDINGAGKTARFRAFTPAVATANVDFLNQSLDSDDAAYSGTISVYDAAGTLQTVNYSMTIDGAGNAAQLTIPGYFDSLGAPLSVDFSFDPVTGALTSPATFNAWASVPVTGPGVAFDFTGLTLVSDTTSLSATADGSATEETSNVSFLNQSLDSDDTVCSGSFDVFDAMGTQQTINYSMTIDGAGNTAQLTIPGYFDSADAPLVVDFTFDPTTGALTSPATFSAWGATPVSGPGISFDFTGLTLSTDSTSLSAVADGSPAGAADLFDASGNPLDINLTFDPVTGAVNGTTAFSAWTSTPVTGTGISLNFAGLTMTTNPTAFTPAVNGNGKELIQSGSLVFGTDGTLQTQNNNSIWFRPQVEKKLEWPTNGVNVAQGITQSYVGIDGETHQINVTYTEISSGLYNWQALDDDGNLLSEGTYNADEKTHTGSVVYSSYAAANKMNLTLDFSEVTSSDGDNTLAVSYRDGARNGSLKSYSIDFAGNIVGEFTNGMMRSIGQIALAKFANPAGLQKAGDTTFVESNNSGIAQLGKAGTVGFGSITPGSLEMSNVDLSQEFTDMIVTQRGLQANSRIITTSDEVLQEIVNLKR